MANFCWCHARFAFAGDLSAKKQPHLACMLFLSPPLLLSFLYLFHSHSPTHSKVLRRRTSLGRTQAGDVLIISRTGEAGLCSYCWVSMFLLGQLKFKYFRHSEKNAAKDLWKRFPSHLGTVKTKISMFFSWNKVYVLISAKSQAENVLISEWNSRLMFFGTMFFFFFFGFFTPFFGVRLYCAQSHTHTLSHSRLSFLSTSCAVNLVPSLMSLDAPDYSTCIQWRQRTSFTAPGRHFIISLDWIVLFSWYERFGAPTPRHRLIHLFC